MTASTSLHSNAFNFLSYVNTGTDPRTGLYTCTISLPALKTNFLIGPEVPLQLRFSPLNHTDSGLGLGWDLQLSQYNPADQILSLSTGETFCVTGSGPQPDIREKKLDSFHFFNDGRNNEGQYVYRVIHKSGLVEILTADSAGKIALPWRIRSAQGQHVELKYVDYADARLLASIDDADGTRLLSLERKTDTVNLIVHPDTAYQALFLMQLGDRKVTSIQLPTADKATWHFEYFTQPEGGLRIVKVKTPVGGVESISYAQVPHYFPGVEGRTLARVASHRNDPGFGSPAIETRYDYPDDHHNFLGYGSNVVWRDDGLDNLYRAPESYVYGSTEHLWDVNSDRAVRSTTRTFNRFHLMTVEETVQNDNVLRSETVYHLQPGIEFENQPAYCQLPHIATQIWYSKSNPMDKRPEPVTTTYDDWGNLLTQVNANEVTETCEWYEVAGEVDEHGDVLCPPDPQQFKRNLKRKTVTPAASDYGQAPVLQTRYRYTEQRGLTGVSNSRWLALSEELLLQDGNAAAPLQHSAFSYIDEPDTPFKHGRKLQDAVTL
ncbi:sugar-binding protein, partial [Pseudomonas umsongensis]|nr:sugar-binding protein [Pseudomonas umsongensis]